jgi:uncharacterized protein (UPF0297 family)
MNKVILAIIILFISLPIYSERIVVSKEKIRKSLFSEMTEVDCNEIENEILETIFVRLQKKYVDHTNKVVGYFFEADSTYFGFLKLSYNSDMKIDEIAIFNLLDKRIVDDMRPTFIISFFEVGGELLVYEPYMRQMFIFSHDSYITVQRSAISNNSLINLDN